MNKCFTFLEKKSQEISVVFHNVSNCDHYFVIKELENKFKGKFECLVENTENYKLFSVSIEKEVTKVGKDGNGSVVTISCKIKLIDSARLMAT